MTSLSSNEKKNKTKEFKDIVGNLSDSSAQKILESNRWDIQSAVNDYFNNSSKYDSEKKAAGSPDKVRKLFDKYADSEDKEIMSEEGTIQFFKDVGVSPDGHETLAIAWLLNSTEMGLFQRKEFVDGFAGQGCTTIQEIKGVIKGKISSLGTESQFRQFYKWVFQHVKEDEKKKTIPINLATQLWKIVLGSKQKDLPLLEKWLAWCEQAEDFKVVNRDVWEQVYDFLKETKTLNSYDDSGAWPVQVDEFIEWAKEQKS